MKGIKKSIVSSLMLSMAAIPSLAYAADCSLEFDDVKSQQVKIADYIDSKKGCYPPLRKALEQGGLEDVLFEPDNEKLLEILADSYHGELDGFTEYLKGELNSYYFAQILGQHSLILPSGISNIAGSKKYLVLFDEVFNEGIVANDPDFNSTLEHNLKIIKDLNEGISYGSQTVDLEDIGEQNISQAFFDNLIKVRAYSSELDDVMTKYAIMGEFGISTGYLADIATSFRSHYKNLGSWAKTEREKEILDLELKENLLDINNRTGGFDLVHKAYGVTLMVGFNVGRF